MNIAVTFIGAWSTADVDFPSIGQSEANIDLVQAATAVVLAGRPHHDMASGDPTEAIFESGNIVGNVLAHFLGWLEPVKFDSRCCFHDLFPTIGGATHVGVSQRARYQFDAAAALAIRGMTELIESMVSAVKA